jgi:hypothetical protein
MAMMTVMSGAPMMAFMSYLYMASTVGRYDCEVPGVHCVLYDRDVGSDNDGFQVLDVCDNGYLCDCDNHDCFEDYDDRIVDAALNNCDVCGFHDDPDDCDVIMTF